MDPSKGPKAYPFAQGLSVDASHRYRIELVETKPVERVGGMVEYFVVSVIKGSFKHPLPER